MQQRLNQNAPPNKVVSWKRMTNSKVNIPRLYTAYRVLLDDRGGGGGEVKLDVGQISKKAAIAEENDADTIKKLVESHKTLDKPIKTDKQSNKDLRLAKMTLAPPFKLDDTTERTLPDENNSNDVEDVKKKSYMKKLKDKDHLIAKTKVPSKNKVDSSKSPIDMNPAEKRIVELNQIYTDFMKAWRNPTSDSQGLNLLGEKNTFPVPPVRLSALNELVNIVENLKQSNPVDDIVKAINDEMNPEKECLISTNKLTANDNPKSLQAHRQTAKKFKRVAPNVDEVKTGGLYEDYKKKLHGILQADKHPPKFLKGKSLKELTQCHCDEVKTAKISIDGGGPKISKDSAPCHCEATKSESVSVDGNTGKMSNGLIPCHCEAMKGINMAVVPDARKSHNNKEHLKQMETSKENTLNDGSNPYYISNSKQRQMVWNEIPLVKSDGKDKSEQPISGAPKVLAKNAPNLNEGESNATKAVLNNKTMQKSGTHSATFIKNQTQLQQILKIFQTRHHCINVEKALKRSLPNNFDATATNIAFPEVLVNKIGQVPVAGGGKMIESMARELNVSPVEMAQRIAGMDSNLGAPCELTGSWESLLLGIRINIKDDNKPIVKEIKPTCYQPKVRRQCVKFSQAQMKERLEEKTNKMTPLNITIQDTLPPRVHNMIDNITEWIFTGHTINTLGGPITLSCRRLNSNLMGTFMGFCKKCGCIDTIFGSWTFCLPSRDCQDVTMSIFDRRDILRRFRLDDIRRERFKENLYTKFGKQQTKT
ncbi:GH16345 [Drosophila grimshawi]|uniref:GH16345 n=1 Tax=Drosophila grimshawi TaxID=7222 RepID=B4JU86_DROGR|nr:GH16345 [Drosophila grimshawi]